MNVLRRLLSRRAVSVRVSDLRVYSRFLVMRWTPIFSWFKQVCGRLSCIERETKLSFFLGLSVVRTRIGLENTIEELSRAESAYEEGMMQNGAEPASLVLHVSA